MPLASVLTLPFLSHAMQKPVCRVSDGFPGFERLPGGPGICFSCRKCVLCTFQKSLCTSFIKLHLLVCACAFYHTHGEQGTEGFMQELVASRKLKSLGSVAGTLALSFLDGSAFVCEMSVM